MFPLKENTTLVKGKHYEIITLPTLVTACNAVRPGVTPTSFHVNGIVINLNGGKAVQICGKVTEVLDNKYHLSAKVESYGSTFNIKAGKFREIAQAVQVGNMET